MHSALCLLLLTTLQLYHLPLFLPPPSVALFACSLVASPRVPAVVLQHCTFQVAVLSPFHSCPTLCGPVDCSPPGSSSTGFSRQEYRSGSPCSPPGDLPDTEIQPTSLLPPALAGRSFTTGATCPVNIQDIFFLFCICFLHIICVKSITNLLHTVLHSQLCWLGNSADFLDLLTSET